ncbi:unnamed protein product, partial [Prorocentrum cordatum]
RSTTPSYPSSLARAAASWLARPAARRCASRPGCRAWARGLPPRPRTVPL